MNEWLAGLFAHIHAKRANARLGFILQVTAASSKAGVSAISKSIGRGARDFGFSRVAIMSSAKYNYDSASTSTWIDIVWDEDIQALRQQYARLAEEFDLIVVDCPPTSSPAFSRVLPGDADGILFVIEAERSRPAAVRNALEIIHNQGGKILSAALNYRKEYIPGWVYERL